MKSERLQGEDTRFDTGGLWQQGVAEACLSRCDSSPLALEGLLL
jgi:hypothetical protein